uniref:28S ribosomal protein S34, mitochondrial-like n=1 Tax=Phallusia mammillata TaxID=59560 RepID=A0A6F9DLZ6_9ASCI|nr:28S ribosomal protein S34, mitochondrial-like [Phallusia mammillata]
MASKSVTVERKLMDYITKKYRKPPHEIIASPQFNWVPEKVEQRRKTEKRLFQILNQLPHWGIGRLFVSISQPLNFWKVTRVSVDHESSEMDCGYAWGILTEDGYSVGYEKEMPFVNESCWRLIPKHEESRFLNYRPKSKTTHEVPLYIPVPPLLAVMDKEAHPEMETDDKEPMVRLLIERNKKKSGRQRHPDGTLV